MQVLLLNVVPSLGNPGELVSVKAGYARNYLVPQGHAIVATPKNIKQFEHQKRTAEARRIKFLEEIRTIADKVNNQRIDFLAKVGPQGKLYGSITNRMVAEKLSEEIGTTIDRTNIALEKPIREAGDYILEVKLDTEITARVKIHIEGELDIEAIAAAEESAAEQSSDEAQASVDDSEEGEAE